MSYKQSLLLDAIASKLDDLGAPQGSTIIERLDSMAKNWNQMIEDLVVSFSVGSSLVQEEISTDTIEKECVK